MSGWVDTEACDKVEISFIKDLFEGDARYTQKFTVYGNGVIRVDNKFEAIKGDHSNMFKFGNEMILPKEFTNIKWYGKGPFEAYSDRQHAAKVGLYNQSIASQYFPYIRPQDTGNKLDVRWVKLTQNEGTGIKIYGEDLLMISALNYSRDDLDSGKKKTQHHAGELEVRQEVFVNVDGFQQGLGGIDSWGEIPLQEYRLPYESYRYSYWIAPID